MNIKSIIENPNFPYVLGVVLVIIYIILMKICYKLLNKLFLKAVFMYKKKIGDKVNGIHIGNYKLVDSKMQFRFIYILFKVIKLMIFTIISIVSLLTLFYFNPTTSKMVSNLFNFVSSPVKMIFLGILNAIPNFLIIVIIILVVRYILRFLRYLSTEISKETLKVKGFYPEWATPTYNLTKVAIYLLTITIISPYLPGAGSDAFKGVSIFAGILISLGSSTYVGNAIAGFILTYMRSFKRGDRIQVNGITGDVVEKTLLVTRLKTVKNERITIPNASILSGHIINYTYSASKYTIVIHTSITIGYDVDWRLVHRLLIQSAAAVDGILPTPTPFVLQKSLDDYYVEYEINGYTKQEKRMQGMLSDLHANIQDNFHKAGVEIMSPHYKVNRLDKDLAIPEKYLKKEEEPKKQENNEPKVGLGKIIKDVLN